MFKRRFNVAKRRLLIRVRIKRVFYVKHAGSSSITKFTRTAGDVRPYVRTYVRMYVRTYVRMYVHAYVRTYKRPLRA